MTSQTEPMTVEPPSCFSRNDMSISARKARKQESRPSKDGPKFQEGARYPSGKLKPVDQRDKGLAPAVVRRIVDLAKRGANDPRLGSAVGMLHLCGDVSARQFAAASRYAKIRGRYDRAMGMPGRFTLSPDYGTARAISNREPLTEADVETIKRQHREMMAAIDAGVTEAWCVPDGKGGFKHVGEDASRASKAYRSSQRVALLDRVLVDDLPAEWSEISALCTALDGLAAFWRIEA